MAQPDQDKLYDIMNPLFEKSFKDYINEMISLLFGPPSDDPKLNNIINVIKDKMENYNLKEKYNIMKDPKLIVLKTRLKTVDEKLVKLYNEQLSGYDIKENWNEFMKECAIAQIIIWIDKKDNDAIKLLVNAFTEKINVIGDILGTKLEEPNTPPTAIPSNNIKTKYLKYKQKYIQLKKLL